MKLLLILTMLLTQANTFTYGYMDSDTVLYSDPELLTPVTTLPATYFVIILEHEATYNKVSYKDISGYIRNVEEVDYEPVTKYADYTFCVNNDGYPTKLRISPDANSEVIMEIPSGKSGYYYGDVSGSTLIAQVGDKWHYVSYDSGSKTHYGYVYSSQVTVSEPRANVIEKVAAIDKGEENSSPLPNTDFLLIALLCVPSILIMFLIFRDKERSPRYKD